MSAAAPNWNKIFGSLGLGKNTVSQLQAFRQRSVAARSQLASLQEQKTDVDFAHYRKVLKNQEVVDKVEKILKDFKPVTYDVGAQVKALDAFEAKATEQATATASKIEAELKDLKATLSNINDARPFEELSVDDVIAARPELKATVETMVKNGKWEVPGYNATYPNLSAL